ncbi:MAG TPA: PAS domain-containing protein, partial [Pseudomonas sp.]|nr:PAS domain-containing protein [Pseudomonas sp.]
MDSRAEILNQENADNRGSEADRLAALSRYRIIGTPPETAFDDLAMLAADLCGCASAAIVFNDGERQWVKASIGNEDSSHGPDPMLCARAMGCSQPLIIPDLADDPLAKGLSGFFAAVALRSPEGLPLGMLSVMDKQPRQLSERQLAHLQALARQVMALLELRCSHEYKEKDRHSDGVLGYAASVREAEER